MVNLRVEVSGKTLMLALAVDSSDFTIQQLMELSLSKSGNADQPVTEWELRTHDGRLLECGATLKDAGVVDGQKLHLLKEGEVDEAAAAFHEVKADLHGSTDASVWAAEFVRHMKKNGWTIDDIDEGLMLGWFANAMCAQMDTDVAMPPLPESVTVEDFERQMLSLPSRYAEGTPTAADFDRAIVEKIYGGIALRIVDVMNQAVAADREAVEELLNHRVACNSTLGDHSSIQVAQHADDPPSEEKVPRWTVGMLGFLNGIAGGLPDGYGRIEAICDVECTVCILDSTDEQLEGKKVGDLCPECGVKLVLGDLVGFTLSDASAHQGEREVKNEASDSGNS